MSFESKPTVPTFGELLVAATAANTILAMHGIPHAFLGGFVMNCLKESRYTGSIDVEMGRPLFGSWNKIVRLFKESGRYHVMKGNNSVMVPERNGFTRRIRMRLIDMKVGVQIYVLESKRWKSIPLQEINGLPVYAVTYLLVDKVKCCGQRHHLADVEDIVILYTAYRKSLDKEVIRKTLTPQDATRALRRHPHNGLLLKVMQDLRVLPEGRKWYCL